MTREVDLETGPEGVTIVARGERVGRYNSDLPPGLRAIQIAGRTITSGPGKCGLCLSHGNINGLSFGYTDSPNSGTLIGRMVSCGLTARRGSQSVGFRHDMKWQDPAGNTVLDVGFVLRAVAASSGGVAFDIGVQFSAGEQDDVVLGVTPCSLLHLNLNAKLFPSGGGHVRNGLGDFDERGIDGRRAPWFGCVGVIDTETVGISLIDHPDNPTHPPSWRTTADGCVTLSPFETCSITLLSNESVTLRFRLQTHVGYVDDGWTSSRAAEFAREPLRT